MRCLFSGMEWFPECKDGGLDRYFYEQLVALAAAGVQGEALASSANSTAVGGINVDGMARRGAPLWQRWRGVRRLARLALESGVEVVNAHFALYAYPWLGAIPETVPLVVNFQGPWAQEIVAQSASWKRKLVSRFARHIEHKVYRRADRVITLSSAFRDLIHRDYGVPLERVRVIPGALDPEPYLRAPEPGEARRRLGWPAERVILLTVRRLAKRMGLDLLIDAIAQVRTEFPAILLQVGGRGPERSALAERVAQHGLEEHVHFLGFVAEGDLPLAYAAADVTLVPSVSLEGFGLTTAESLASGTPVLGTPVGGTPEILRPLNPDLIFAAATAEAMAQRLREVLRGSIRLPDREACRAYAQRYSWSAVTPRILEVYHEAIEERRAR